MSSKARLSMVAAALALAGCGGLSDVGEQRTLAPTAVAQVIGYTGADASGDSTATVRAHTEVLLTGKESIEADKPILSFQWKAVNPANDKYVTVRNTNTINVSVPVVTAATDMQYQLTVTDSDGDSDTSMVTLHVQPVLDADRFLNYLTGVPKLRLIAATPQPSAAGGRFRLELTASVKYPTRPSNLGDIRFNTVAYPLGQPVEGEWLSSAQPGTDGGASDVRNPVFEFSMPAINLDEIIKTIQADLPGSQAKFPDPAFIDSSEIEVIAKLTPITAVSTVSLIAPDAVDETGAHIAPATNAGTGAAVELHLSPATVDRLRLSSGGIENAVTASSYYDAIDAGNATPKTTLTEWLRQNCFDPAAANYGAEAHAAYVNNFDLGFGRDMYFIGTKPAGCTSATFGAGNAAAVVINYPTLEATVKKVDPVIAVAMEYRNADANRGTPGTVVFYIFAPDQGTGEFRRVLSANFDGRGEKYLPGACTMCHGGKPLPAAVTPATTYNANNTNIGATFMPWDLESFLFSDNDTSFPTDSANAALHAQFTRAKQEGEFKKLNLGALGTYGSRNGATTTCYADFTGPCDLVKLWYGDDLAAATFINSQVGKGWRVGGQNANPQSAEDLYKNVFARNCRACHTQRVVNAPNALDLQFHNYADFVSTTPQQPNTLAMHDRIVNQVFRNGVMPGARLTADRFWVPAPGASTSAGDALAQHLGLAAGTKPGSAFACIESVPNLGATAASREIIPRRLPDVGSTLGAFTAISVDGKCSSFARSFEWLLTKPAASSAAVSGTNTSRGSFSVDTWGDFDIALRVTGIGGDVSTITRYATVPDLHPTAPDLPLTVEISTPTPLDVLAQSDQGDRPTTVVSAQASGTGLSASVVNNQVVVTSSGILGGTVNYSITDVDGGAANTDSGVITVTVNASISANAATVDVDPNAIAEIPLSTRVIAAGGQPFVVQLWQPGVGVTNTETTALPARITGGGGSVTLINCTANAAQICARYVVPKRTISRFGATVIGSDDTFSYRACFQADTNRCSDVVVITARIQGHAAFSTVASTITNSSCLSCHTSAQSGAAWTVASNPSNAQVFQAIRCQTGISPDAADAGVRYVNITTPSASLIYLKPGGGNNHGGGNILDAGERQPFLDWITEGGYYTAGGQTCSPL